MALVCGCWVLFGVGFSTVSAQSEWPLRHSVAVPMRRLARRGRHRHGESECLPVAASYSRYSSDRQDESSITDQQRICRERAEDDGFQILPKCEFFDEAISGTKRKRDGLDALLQTAERGEFQVLYFHNLSRLARESVIGMPILKTLVYTYGVRIISVTEGVDSTQTGWETLATFICLHHEMFIRDLAANVLKGLIGTILSGFCVGDQRFGYDSIPSPNGEMVGRGRNAKPRMVYRIQPEQAEIVRQVFQWFVRERRRLAWIVREMNRRRVPKDHRASTPDWDRAAVIRLLRSEKYVGLWWWGLTKTHRDPTTGDKWQEDRPEEETAKWLRHLPDLRIVEDEIFFEAQRRLDENNARVQEQRDAKGRLHGSEKGTPSGHLFSGLVQCLECLSTFNVGGANGKYLSCPKAKNGTCSCKTTLNRARAERMILEVIGQRLLQDESWIQAVIDTTTAAWHENRQSRPDEAPRLRQEIQQIERKIEKLLDQLEADDNPAPEIRDRLKTRRHEKQQIERRLRELELAPQAPAEPPTAEWVREALAHLADSLNGEPDLAREALRGLLAGRIVVQEIESIGQKRRILRGTLVLPPAKTVKAIANWHHAEPSAAVPTQGDPNNESITIDFREPSWIDDREEEVWRLYQHDVPQDQIAEMLRLDRSQLTKILKRTAKKHGVELPDGRSRRARLKHNYHSLYAGLIEQAMELWNQGLLIGQIAERLQVNPATVTKAVEAWHRQNGVPMPDGRSRRKTLEQKSAPKRRSHDDESPFAAAS